MAIALVTSSYGSQNTAAVDTTGADFLWLGYHTAGEAPTFADSKSNSWTSLTYPVDNSVPANLRTAYSLPTSVGSGHTCGPAPVFWQDVMMAAFSGVEQTSPLDTEAEAASGSAVTSHAAGSVTPSVDGCLIICELQLTVDSVGFTAPSGFTLESGTRIAWLVQTTAATVNPSWSWTNSQRALAKIAVFKPAAASGPTIGTQPTAQTANEPATATFTVSATTSGGTLHYQWKRAAPGSGTFSNVGTDSNSYTTGATSAASDHGASFKVDVTDDNGTTVSDTVVLTVRSTTTVARPSADVSATGWTASTGSDLFAMIDEASASDADYITSPTITGSTAPATFTLAYPLNTGSWTLSVRAKTSTGTATLRLYLLNDANTVVGTSGDQTITSSFTTYQLAVTSSGPATRARVEIVS